MADNFFLTDAHFKFVQIYLSNTDTWQQIVLSNCDNFVNQKRKIAIIRRKTCQGTNRRSEVNEGWCLCSKDGLACFSLLQLFPGQQAGQFTASGFPPAYEVIHKDNKAHAVKINDCPRKNDTQWGYAFFDKSVRTPGPVRRVTKVSL